MTDDLQALEDELGGRLRHAFHQVADTVNLTDTPTVARRRWRRTSTMGLAALVTAVGVAAFAAQNEDAIVRLPIETALMSGETSSGDWWLLPTNAVIDACDGQMPGVVLVAEEINRPGGELNAGGVDYGEPIDTDIGCTPRDEEAWLRDPGKTNLGYSRLGFERSDTPWGMFGAFHPTVTAVRVTVDGGAPRTVETVSMPERPDGPRYVAFLADAAASTARVELLNASGAVVPAKSGSADGSLMLEFP